MKTNDQLQNEIVELRKKLSVLEEKLNRFEDTEKELQKSRFLLDETGQMAKVGGWEINVSEKTLTWTKETFIIHELSPDHQPGISDAIHFYHPDDREMVSSLVDHAMKDGLPFDFEARLITTNSNLLWVRASCKTFSEKGKIVGVRGSFQDITDQKKAKKELEKAKEKAEENAEKYRLLHENAGLGIGYYSPEGRVISYNAIAAKNMGGVPEDFTGKSFRELFPLEAAKEYERRLKKAIESEQIQEYEDKVELPNQTIWFLSTYTKIKNSNNKLLGIQIISQDITAIKESEERIKENQNLLQRAEKVSDQGSWKWDIIHDKWSFSNNWLKIHGFENSGISKDELLKIAHPDDRSFVDKAFADAINNIQPYSIEHRIIRKDNGEIREVKANGEVHFNKEGKPEFMIGVAQDITDQKKAKEELTKSNANITAIIEGTLSSIWAFDTDYKILYINHVFQEEFEQSFGVKLKPGMSLIESLPKEIRPFWKPRYDRVLANEQFTIEDEVPTALGNIFIEVTFNPIIKDGLVIGGSCLGSNITPRKVAEIELKNAKIKAEEGEAKITSIIEGSSNSIWAFDRNYKVLYINNLFQQEFLKSFGVLLKPGMDLLAAHPDIVASIWRPRYDRVLKNEQYTIEDAVPTKKGTVYVEISFTPIVKNGEVIGGACIGNDITQRKLAEQELIIAKEKAEDNKDKFKSLNRLTTEMLFLPDMKSIYNFIGEGLKSHLPNTIILCNSIDESNKTVILESVTGLDNKYLKQIIKISGFNPVGRTFNLKFPQEKVLKTGNFFEFDGGLKEYSGSEFPAFAATAIEKLMGLHKIYTIGINKDDELLAAIHFVTFNNYEITDSNFIEVFSKQIGLIIQKKIVESDLLKAKEKAEAANIHKNYFLANMSHEIRTPMNGVLGFTNLILEEDFEIEERNRYLNIIKRNSHQLLNLIDEIIDISKIESNELKINLEECSLFNVFSDLEENYHQIKRKSKKENIEFKMQIPEDHTSLMLKTDGLRLRQVLTNLLDNALKFSEDGTISFGYEVKDSWVAFFVSDQGIGIPQNKVDEIFERFKQLNYKNAAKYGGTGLGLAISRGIIKLLGGDIDVKSEPGKGSTFSFKLPL